MRSPLRIAALLACHNRKPTTLACLTRLFSQARSEELTVFLLDDNSSDGTADAVRARFSQIRVLLGNGQLFWCGGMRRAFAVAMQEDYDFYLWLNDDTLLEPGALARLLSSHQWLSARGYEAAIVAGATRHPRSGRITYGGLLRASRIHPIKYRLLEPGNWPLQCDTMHGNCVLIPRSVVAVTHNLSPDFRHGRGDLDYGLRARKAGCTVWLAPGIIGTCASNKVDGSFLDERLPLRYRWKHMMSNKGLPPREHFRYVRKYGGPLWPVLWTLPYVRVVLGSFRAALRHQSSNSHQRGT